jgi:putative FmdB family regulatory protein
MPIYEYRCADCGFEEEYLQKISEPPLTVCPKCGKPSFRKKLTAAGFQLKGSGWYATDFRGGSKPEAKTDAKTDAKPEGKAESKTEAKSESKAAPKKPDAPASGGTTTS